MLAFGWIAAIAAVAFLGWLLYRHIGTSHLQAFNDQRRATSRLVSRGEFVDGNRHMMVALALTDQAFFYENDDMHASLDLRWIRQVEYDTCTATGNSVVGGEVLRLRCFSQVFEFVILNDVAPRWHQMLPARETAESGGETAARLAVSTT